MPATNLNPDNSPDNSVHATRGGNANHIPININLGTPTLIVIMLLVAIIGATGVVMGIDIADREARSREEQERLLAFSREENERATKLHDAMQDMQRQARMTELKLDDWTVVAHRAGLVLPGDYTRGPQGNVDAEAFKFGSKPKRGK